jgi:hypothetical protein
MCLLPEKQVDGTFDGEQPSLDWRRRSRRRTVGGHNKENTLRRHISSPLNGRKSPPSPPAFKRLSFVCVFVIAASTYKCDFMQRK